MTNTKVTDLCSLSTDFRQLFEPLIAQYGITYVAHLRLFNNGTAYELSNNPQHLQHFFEKKYAIPEPGIYTESEMLLWSSIPELQKYDGRIADMRNCFNIDHQVGIIYPGNGYIDRFALGTVRHKPEIINFYINNRDVLGNLFQQYQEKFAAVITKLDHNPLAMPLRPKAFKASNQTFANFVDLTQRELDCLQLLAQGQTAKMIGKALMISPRTVEKHLDHIRSKLNVRHKSEIITKFNELNVQLTSSK
jgi:DNA-binding CsgD family transcriptional regulator